MHEHELWITALFNDYLAGVGNAILNLVAVHAHDAARPWNNFISMEILVAAIIMIVALVVKTSLSFDKPGKLQQSFELIYEFLSGQSDEMVGHDGHKYVAFFGTLFIFILFSNLIGVIPGFESPTMFPAVPAGCAMATFLVYNILGIREHGFKYILQFSGTNPWIAPLLFPIEIISHFARPLSLTVRLYANMFAGEKVTLVFLTLVPAAIPSIFMGLHVFVSILQAYIFTVLTMIYLGSAISHEEH